MVAVGLHPKNSSSAGGALNHCATEPQEILGIFLKVSGSLGGLWRTIPASSNHHHLTE